jgi:patatin-like phospholipase/acyl hydrolase
VKILAIDGGGVRGVIPLLVLSRLERALGRPLRRHFDLVAGTSTGALVAAAVAAEVPAIELLVKWPRIARDVFARRALHGIVSAGISRPRYDSRPLADAISRVVGQRNVGSLSAATMFVACDTRSGRPFVVKSWRGEHRELPLVDVLLASCAAPGYFPGVELAGRPLVDGGLAANNPSACAVAEAIRLKGGAAQDVRLLSLGTGAAPEPIHAGALAEWGFVEWAPRILGQMFVMQAAAVDYVCAELLGDRYLRAQPEVPEAIRALDDADAVPALMDAARAYLTEDREAALVAFVDARAAGGIAPRG